MTEAKYFNAPIQLWADFMSDDRKGLSDVFDYAIYAHTLNLTEGTEAQKFKAACKFFYVTSGDDSKSIKNGKKLLRDADPKAPKVGINTTVWFDFYKNPKTEYDKVCLLAFLAIKSIVQNKPYTKLDNRFWLSRMAGNANSCDLKTLPEWIQKYSNEYQTKKLKIELRNNWGLVTYSRYTRGFYVSFKLSLEDLVFEAEKRRKVTKDKQFKKLENEAVQKALQRLQA